MENKALIVSDLSYDLHHEMMALIIAKLKIFYEKKIPKTFGDTAILVAIGSIITAYKNRQMDDCLLEDVLDRVCSASKETQNIFFNGRIDDEQSSDVVE